MLLSGELYAYSLVFSVGSAASHLDEVLGFSREMRWAGIFSSCASSLEC